MDEVEENIKIIVKKLDYRNKLIKLQDTDENGWSVVAEYERNKIAEGSDDKKIIFAAEERKLKRTSTGSAIKDHSMNSRIILFLTKRPKYF